MVIKVEEPEVLIDRLTSKPLVLYGMGTIGMRISQWLDEFKIHHIFADRNPLANEKKLNKTVITPDRLKIEYANANVIVSSNIYYDEIRSSLLENGFEDSQILSYALFMPQSIVWTDLESCIDWDLMKPSVELFSKWIDKSILSVADYGAGQMYLKSFLNSDVKYIPIDYMKRFEETMVCDLNMSEFPALETDASVLNGVLEFLTTAEKLLKHVCENTSKLIIISYMTIDKFSSVQGRRASGYVSDLSDSRIIELLKEGGFQLTRKESDPKDNTDTIYLFKKKGVVDEIR